LRMARFLHGVLPVLAVLAIGLAVSACSSLGQVTEAEQQQILATAQAPRLQSGEKIRVTVYNEPSLSGDFQIDPSGFVSLHPEGGGPETYPVGSGPPIFSRRGARDRPARLRGLSRLMMSQYPVGSWWVASPSSASKETWR